MSAAGPAANPKSASRKSRNASPAPKANAAVTTEIPSVKAEVACGKTTEVQSVKAPEKKAEEVTEAHILGLHPEAFIAMVVVPLAVFVLLAAALGPGRSHIETAVAVGTKHWKTVSAPVEKFLIERSNLLVVVAAGAVFMPLVILTIVVLCRALQDLNNFALWQQLVLAALVLAALATLRSDAFVWCKGTWDNVRDPLQKLLTERADHIVAGSALVALSPVAIAVGMYFLRCLWGCRVQLVSVDAKDDDAKK